MTELIVEVDAIKRVAKGLKSDFPFRISYPVTLIYPTHSTLEHHLPTKLTAQSLEWLR